MKRASTVFALLFALAALLPADEWYSIDGFYLRTDGTIWIDAPTGGESTVVEFLLDDDLTPSARGYLIGAEPGTEGSIDGRIDGRAGALVQLIRAVESQTGGEQEIRSIAVRPGPATGGGSSLITVKTTRSSWFAARIHLGETPGGVYSYLLIFSLVPEEDPTIVERLLRSLTVEITGAAG